MRVKFRAWSIVYRATGLNKHTFFLKDFHHLLRINYERFNRKMLDITGNQIGIFHSHSDFIKNYIFRIRKKLIKNPYSIFLTIKK